MDYTNLKRIIVSLLISTPDFDLGVELSQLKSQFIEMEGTEIPLLGYHNMIDLLYSMRDAIEMVILFYFLSLFFIYIRNKTIILIDSRRYRSSIIPNYK